MTDSEVTFRKMPGNLPSDGPARRRPVPPREMDLAAALSRLTTLGAESRRAQIERGAPAAGSQMQAASAGLEKVTTALLAAARVQPGDLVIDLGCGSGQVSLQLAELGARVVAVDGNQRALDRLKATALARSLPGFEVLASPLFCLSLPVASADLVVTSYAMHWLRDTDKQQLVTAAFSWLRPGGTLIVADMMFGRGASSQDRAIIRSKVRSLARKGIGGWWRIAKNGYRYLVQAKDHPMSISAWTSIFAGAGFTGITASRIVNEAGLVLGRKPITD